jgi:hypothetical protein
MRRRRRVELTGRKGKQCRNEKQNDEAQAKEHDSNLLGGRAKLE